MIVLASMLVVSSCNKGDINEVNYTPQVVINFEGVGDSNIVVVKQGVTSYTANIAVQSSGTEISGFEIYSANTKTGARGELDTARIFDDAQPSYSYTHTLEGLTENKGIKVVVTDTLGNVFERNLIVKISPSVLVSEALEIETVENYYGPYLATWLNGRVYMRRNEQYKDQIDLSLGGIPIGTDTLPHLVNPAARGSFNLLTLAGLQATKFAATSYTTAQFNGINQVDGSLISSLSDPQKDTVRLENNKVYLFKTANGKKGLVSITGLTRKTGTIEVTANNWVPGSAYYEALITAKTLAP